MWISGIGLRDTFYFGTFHSDQSNDNITNNKQKISMKNDPFVEPDLIIILMNSLMNSNEFSVLP